MLKVRNMTLALPSGLLGLPRSDRANFLKDKINVIDLETTDNIVLFFFKYYNGVWFQVNLLNDEQCLTIKECIKKTDMVYLLCGF